MPSRISQFVAPDPPRPAAWHDVDDEVRRLLRIAYDQNR